MWKAHSQIYASSRGEIVDNVPPGVAEEALGSGAPGASIDYHHTSLPETVDKNDIPQYVSRLQISRENANNTSGGRITSIQHHESTSPVPNTQLGESSSCSVRPVMEHMDAGDFERYKALQHRRGTETLENLPPRARNEIANRLRSHIFGIENFTRKPVSRETTPGNRLTIGGFENEGPQSNRGVFENERPQSNPGVFANEGPQNNRGIFENEEPQNNGEIFETTRKDSVNNTSPPMPSESVDPKTGARRTETVAMRDPERKSSKLLKKKIRAYIKVGDIAAAKALILTLKEIPSNKKLVSDLMVKVDRKVYSQGVSELNKQNEQAALNIIDEFLELDHQGRRRTLQVEIAEQLLRKGKSEITRSKFQEAGVTINLLRHRNLQGINQADEYRKELEARFVDALKHNIRSCFVSRQGQGAEPALQEFYKHNYSNDGDEMALYIAKRHLEATMDDVRLGFIGVASLKFANADRVLGLLSNVSDQRLGGLADTKDYPSISNISEIRSTVLEHLNRSQEKIYPDLGAGLWDVAWNFVLGSFRSRRDPKGGTTRIRIESEAELLQNLESQLSSLISVSPSWLILICHVAVRIRRWDIASNISILTPDQVQQQEVDYQYLYLLSCAEIEYFHKRSISSARVHLNQAVNFEGCLHFPKADALYLLGRILTRDGLLEDAEYYQSLIPSQYARHRIFGSPWRAYHEMSPTSPAFDGLSFSRREIGGLISSSSYRFKGNTKENKHQLQGLIDVFLEWHDTTGEIGIDAQSPRIYNIQHPASISDCTIFDFFALWGRNDLLRLALGSPALSEIISVNRRDSQGNTTLHWTAKSYNIQGLNLLLNHIKSDPTEHDAILQRWESETSVGIWQNPVHLLLSTSTEGFNGKPLTEVLGILLDFCPLLAAGKDHKGETPVHRLTASVRIDFQNLKNAPGTWWETPAQTDVKINRQIENYKHYRDCYAIIFKDRTYEECVQLRDAQDHNGTKAVDKTVYDELLGRTGDGIQIFNGASEFMSSVARYRERVEAALKEKAASEAFANSKQKRHTGLFHLIR
ncbi:hypothetical protein TWF281_007107 [Arthrobotrys megalospora]